MDYAERLSRIMRARGVNLVLDVGANSGQFATSLRANGYSHRIVSFEPMTGPYAALEQASRGDPAWSCVGFGLGDRDHSTEINVSENSYSSSLLDVFDWTLSVEPSIGYVRREKVEIRRLDGVYSEVARLNERVMLKIDTQGYELPILRGASDILHKIELIQLEVSFRPVYVGEPLIEDVLGHMTGEGFHVIAVNQGWEDLNTCELLQADLLFSR